MTTPRFVVAARRCALDDLLGVVRAQVGRQSTAAHELLLISSLVYSPEKHIFTRSPSGRAPARSGVNGPAERAFETSTMRPFRRAQTLMPPPRCATTRLTSQWSFPRSSATHARRRLDVERVHEARPRDLRHARSSARRASISSTHGGSTMNAGMSWSHAMPNASTAPRFDGVLASHGLPRVVYHALVDRVGSTDRWSEEPSAPDHARRAKRARCPRSSRNSRMSVLAVLVLVPHALEVRQVERPCARLSP